MVLVVDGDRGGYIHQGLEDGDGNERRRGEENRCRTNTANRECWCANSLSSLSEKLPDSACNLPCEGDTTQACGGNLKLTVSACFQLTTLDHC